jgi:hypothetical protein
MQHSARKISREEILWTFARLRELIHTEGKTREDAVAQVKKESEGKPWEKT